MYQCKNENDMTFAIPEFLQQIVLCHLRQNMKTVDTTRFFIKTVG